MKPSLPRFSVRLRRALANFSNALRNVFHKNSPSEDFGSQRMCPFCGLITSRRKACCLECGKWLKPA